MRRKKTERILVINAIATAVGDNILLAKYAWRCAKGSNIMARYEDKLTKSERLALRRLMRPHLTVESALLQKFRKNRFCQ